MTNVLFMNDPLELKHPMELLHQFVRLSRFGFLPWNTASIEILQNNILPKMKERATRQFIISTSLSRDDKVLWDRYAPVDGYGLEFEIGSMIEQFAFNRILLWDSGSHCYSKVSRFSGKVIYSELLQRQFIAYTLNYLDRMIADPPLTNGIVNPEVITDIMTRIIHYFYAGLYNMKSAIHEAEHEFRIVAMPDKDFNGVQYRQDSGRAVPYVSVTGLLPAVRAIWIGPGTHDQMALDQIRQAAATVATGVDFTVSTAT
jgi:hypothetical protein